MKNFFKSAMLFAAAAMAFTACSDDDTTDVMPQDEGVRFNVEANIESQTRVEVTGDGGELAWVADKDDILLQYLTEGQTIQKTFLYNNKGTFELNYGTLPTPTAGEKFYATSPSSQYDKNAFAIKAKQTNTYSAEKGFNFDQVPLVAVPFAFEQSMMNGNEVNLSLAMRHVASYIQIRFVTEKADYKNLEVASVMFEDKQGKAVAGQLDRSIVSMDKVPASGNFWMGMTSSSMDATVAFETNYPTVADKTAAADRTNVAYMVVYPGEYLGKFTVKTTDGKTFEVVAPQAKTFARGTVNRIALNLKNHTEGEVVEKPVKILGVNPERIDFASAAAQSQDVVVSVEHFNGLKHTWNLVGSESFTFSAHADQYTWTVNATENTTYQDRNEEVKIQILDEARKVLQEVVIPVTQKAKEITGPAYEQLTSANFSELNAGSRIIITSHDGTKVLGVEAHQYNPNMLVKKIDRLKAAFGSKIPESDYKSTIYEAVLVDVDAANNVYAIQYGTFYLNLSPNFSALGGGVTTKGIQKNQKMTISADAEGNSQIQATNFDANNQKDVTGCMLWSDAADNGKGSFVSSEGKQNVRIYFIKGAPQPASASVTPTEFNFAQAGGEQEFVVTIKNKKADKSYAWTASAVDHFTAVNTTNGVKVTAPANETTSKKSATMKITVTENGAVLLEQNITLTQDAQSGGGNQPASGYVELTSAAQLTNNSQIIIVTSDLKKIFGAYPNGLNCDAINLVNISETAVGKNYFRLEIKDGFYYLYSIPNSSYMRISVPNGAFYNETTTDPTPAWKVKEIKLSFVNGILQNQNGGSVSYNSKYNKFNPTNGASGVKFYVLTK